jgi:hypothetical protein
VFSIHSFLSFIFSISQFYFYNPPGSPAVSTTRFSDLQTIQLLYSDSNKEQKKIRTSLWMRDDNTPTLMETFEFKVESGLHFKKQIHT